MSTLVTLAAIAALAAFVYHYIPKDHPGRAFRVEQFRPAAPLAGILDDGPDPPESAEQPDGEQAPSTETQTSNPKLDRSRLGRTAEIPLPDHTSTASIQK